jgi:hypothetical protein
MVICRGCGASAALTFLDLGASPIANDLIPKEKLDAPEIFLPLHVKTCQNCCFVQLGEVATRESIFHSDYVYFSSYSSSWLKHAQIYATKMIELLNLTKDDFVVEVASNDGYLLQFFLQNEIEVMGVEPSMGVAEVAIEKGIPTLIEFFGEEVALEIASKKKAKLLIGNNVLAHVPDIHDFIKGFATLISRDGLITFEFPHLVSLIKFNQFDTIYHEHYSYLSITALLPIFQRHGLRLIDVEKISTHGGSLRLYVGKVDSKWEVNDSVHNTLLEEMILDPRQESVWGSLQEKALEVKINLLEELVRCKKSGLNIAAYGAPAKGNTLLNYCGIDSDLISYAVDINPHKQGSYLPGSRIPVFGLDELSKNTPDVLLVLPWNLADEIKSQLGYLTQNGMKLFRAVPKLEYF